MSGTPERFRPYELPDGGFGVWDAKREQRVEQPGLRDSHWFPNEARAQAWIERLYPAQPQRR